MEPKQDVNILLQKSLNYLASQPFDILPTSWSLFPRPTFDIYACISCYSNSKIQQKSNFN